MYQSFKYAHEEVTIKEHPSTYKIIGTGRIPPTNISIKGSRTLKHPILYDEESNKANECHGRKEITCTFHFNVHVKQIFLPAQRKLSGKIAKRQMPNT
jgi:hypothetical protein